MHINTHIHMRSHTRSHITKRTTSISHAHALVSDINFRLSAAHVHI